MCIGYMQIQYHFIKEPWAAVNFGIHRGSLGPINSPQIPRDDCIVVLDNIGLNAKHLIMIKVQSSVKISCQHLCAVYQSNKIYIYTLNNKPMDKSSLIFVCIVFQFLLLWSPWIWASTPDIQTDSWIQLMNIARRVMDYHNILKNWGCFPPRVNKPRSPP